MTVIKKKSIILKNKGGVSHIILNQPDKHNALSPTMIEELSDAFDNLSKDENTRDLLMSMNDNCNTLADKEIGLENHVIHLPGPDWFWTV